MTFSIPFSPFADQIGRGFIIFFQSIKMFFVDFL